VIRIQPDEAIYLKINNKVPGLGLNLDVTRLDLTYRERFAVPGPPARVALSFTVWSCLRHALDTAIQILLVGEVYPCEVQSIWHTCI